MLSARSSHFRFDPARYVDPAVRTAGHLFVHRPGRVLPPAHLPTHHAVRLLAGHHVADQVIWIDYFSHDGACTLSSCIRYHGFFLKHDAS